MPPLRKTLERIDTLDPAAQDARRLMSIHLPGLIDRYQALGIERCVFRLPSAGADEVLPLLKNWSALVRGYA